MAITVQIDGVGKVQLDDSFKSLSPEQQQLTVDEIANHSATQKAPDVPISKDWKKPTAAPVNAQETWMGKNPDAGIIDKTGRVLSGALEGFKRGFGDEPLAPRNIPAHLGKSYIPNPLAVVSEIGSTALRGLGAIPAALGGGAAGFGDISGMDPTASEKFGRDVEMTTTLAPLAVGASRYGVSMPKAPSTAVEDFAARAAASPVPRMVKRTGAALNPNTYILKGERAATPVLQNIGKQLGQEAYDANLATVTAQSAKAANAAKMLEAAEKAKADAIAARGSIATAAGASAEEAKAKAAEAFANAPNRVLEAGQEATGIAPPLARPAVLSRISAGKAGVDPLFKESFGPKSTAPLKDQYENAFNDASRNAKVAQQELADAETSHTQLLAKANDQTSVYGINPGQIRASEKTIEAASEKAAAAAEEVDRVKTDLGSIQSHILEGKQGAVYTPRIAILLENPKVKSGISRGVRIIQNEADAKGEIPSFKDLSIKIDRQGKPILDKNGDVQPIGVPNTRTLHVAKRGLDAFVNSRKDDFGRIVYDAEGEVKSIQDMSKTLSSEMRRVNPMYDKAMSESEKYLKTRTGFIKGAKSVFDDKLPESDFKDILGRMSQEERDAAIESVSNFANETVRKAAPEAGAKVPLASVSRRSEAKLAMLVGDENASNYMAALRGARPSAKGAALATGKSPALKAAGENIQAAENTAKGLRKDVTASNQELAKALQLSNKMKERQVFYDTAPLEDIGKRATKDLLSDMNAGRITQDQYENSIRTLQAAEKNLGKTQAYRKTVKTVAKNSVRAIGLGALLGIGGAVANFIE